MVSFPRKMISLDFKLKYSYYCLRITKGKGMREKYYFGGKTVYT